LAYDIDIDCSIADWSVCFKFWQKHPSECKGVFVILDLF